MMRDQGFAVEVQHRVTASPDTVFDYFIDPEKQRLWHGVEADLDPRPGGRYRIRYATGVWACGEYLALDRPRRIVLTWGWESDVELPRGLSDVAPGSSTVEFTFEEDGAGTIIRVRHAGLPSETTGWAHELGWKTYVPRLAALLRGEQPGDEPTAKLAAVYFARDVNDRS